MSHNTLSAETLEYFSDKTYDKILKQSLMLFNDAGFNSVTTAYISKKCDILEGTLWYHFNSKKDILSNHIQLLQKVFFSVNQQNKSKDFETIINEFFQSYNIIWDFRYILRDNFQKYFEDDMSISKTITDINNYLDKWAENRILHSHESGLIKINSKEIENLSEITLVIGRYWLDFSMKKYPGVNISSLRLKGLKHIVTVLSPYLNPQGIPTIENMLKQLK